MDVTDERDRLRAARGSATQLLGPTSAAIAIGLFGAFGKGVGLAALVVALSLLLLMVAVGIAADNLPPYRTLRPRAEGWLAQPSAPEQPDLRKVPPAAERHRVGYNERFGEGEWLEHAIDVERAVYGDLDPKQSKFRVRREKGTMQELYEIERTAGYAVRVLFLLIVVDLGVGLAAR